MTISPSVLNGVQVYSGHSLSGYSTRLFVNAEDAEAEEKWLDNKWQLCRDLWSDIRQTDRDMAAGKTLLKIMSIAKKGLRPIEEPDCPPGFYLVRSEGPNELPRILVNFDGNLHEFIGESFAVIEPDFNQVFSSGLTVPKGNR